MSAAAAAVTGAGAAAAAAAPAAVRHSALYVGSVRHRRFDRTGHRFAVRLYMAYVDLAEAPALFAGGLLCSTRWWSWLRFRRADYFGPPQVPLADAVRDAVATATGQRPDGPVRMLTQLRTLGYVFNPVTFYYCFDRGERLQAVLAQITNTPWGERHHYVVAAGAGRPGAANLRARFAKAFHVSPFQPMAQEYRWTVSPPGERLAVHMENHQDGRPVFDATLLLQRRPWTKGALLAALCRHPWMTAKVILGIHWQALRLWCKRAPFFAHPKHRGA